MRILIAEPDEYYHHHYADFLGSLGELRFVKEADGVWGIMEQFQPDVFITELLLPEKGAYEILKKIRSDGKNSAMSVLVFTRVQNMEDIKASLDLGVSGYFVKGKDTLHDIRKLLVNYNNSSPNS